MTVKEHPRRLTCPVVSQKLNIVSDVSTASSANTGPMFGRTAVVGARPLVRVWRISAYQIIDEHHPIVIQSKHLHTHTLKHTHTHTQARAYGTDCGPEGESAARRAAVSAPCCVLLLCGTRRELILQEETSVESQLEEMGGMREGRRKRAGGVRVSGLTGSRDIPPLWKSFYCLSHRFFKSSLIPPQSASGIIYTFITDRVSEKFYSSCWNTSLALTRATRNWLYRGAETNIWSHIMTDGEKIVG